MGDEFDTLLDLEEQFLTVGFDRGVEAGQESGLEDGRELGRQKGMELGKELGAIQGRVMILLALGQHRPGRCSERCESQLCALYYA